MRYKVTMRLDMDIDGTLEEVMEIIQEDKIEILEGLAENVQIILVEKNEDL